MPDTGLPVLDKQGAMELLGLDTSSFSQLIALFKTEIAGWKASFTKCFDDNSEQLRMLAHRLKSDAANVGAVQVSTAAADLEHAVKSGHELSEVELQKARLLTALDRLELELG